MKTSCIPRMPQDDIIILRRSYITACEGDNCAAMLLSFLEYWHNIKLERSAKEDGDLISRDLLQFHNEKELSDGLLEEYSRERIAKAIGKLQQLGFVTVTNNPNPRFRFDKTRFFLLHPEAVAKALGAMIEKPNTAVGKETPREPKIDGQVLQSTSQATSFEKQPSSRKGDKATKPSGQELCRWFSEVWEQYPRKVGRGAAEKAFRARVVSRDVVDQIIEALSWQKKLDDWRKEGGKYIPHFSTYLNAERWLDAKLVEVAPVDELFDEIPSDVMEKLDESFQKQSDAGLYPEIRDGRIVAWHNRNEEIGLGGTERVAGACGGEVRQVGQELQLPISQ